MGRHNYPRKHRRHRMQLLDRYDTDYVDLPEHPELRYLIVKPLKTVFTNVAAAPEAMESCTVKKFDDKLLKLIQRHR